MEVRRARDEDEVAEALALRERIFAGEQGVPRAADRDGRDGEALHVVALEDGQLLGTVRLVFEGDVAHLGRMAVEPSARRQGVASAVLSTAERCAREAGARRLGLHAQVYTEELYVRGGFERSGEPFFQQGIEHVAMEKALA